MGCPVGHPILYCLAAAIVVALAAVAAVVAVAAAAEQQNQDDDPAHIATAEATVTTKVTHNPYLRFFDAAFDAAHSMLFRSRDLVQTLEIVDFCRKLFFEVFLIFLPFSAMIFLNIWQKEGILCRHTNY